MTDYILYLGPAFMASVAGLILCILGIPKRPALCILSAVSGASAWLFYSIMEGAVDVPSEPMWIGSIVGLFSIFGPSVLFICVIAVIAVAKITGPKTSLLCIAAVGLIAAILHAMACVHLLDGLGSC